MHALNDPRVLLRFEACSVEQKSHKLAMRPQNGIKDYECIKINPTNKHVPHPGHHTYTPFTGSWHRKHSPTRRRQLLHIRRALENDEWVASVAVLLLILI